MNEPLNNTDLFTLAELFDFHSSFVPAREFAAAGFNLKQLVTDGWVQPPSGGLNQIGYTMGEALENLCRHDEALGLAWVCK